MVYILDKLHAAIAEKAAGNPVPMCSCAAHSKMIKSGTSRAMKEDLRMMIRSSIPLTDDGGKDFCSAVLQRILQYAHSEGQLRALSSGSEWTVSFVLLHNTDECSFKGYPDFLICKDSIGARVMVVSCGEMQSDGKDPILQVGIYALKEDKHWCALL